MLGIPAPLKIRPSTQPSTLKRYIAPTALALLASFGRGFETAMIQETLSRNPLSVSWDRWISARFQHQQIGRASCRDRVGPSVSISVFGVSFKKKKINKNN